MDEPESEPWLLFTITDTEGTGVEIPKLARLLGDLSSAFYAIAREKIGIPPGKRGSRSGAEDMLASIRVNRLSPGSTVLEIAPPEQQAQTTLDFVTEPDDVAFEFVQECRRIGGRGAEPRAGSVVRRRVREVLKAADEIGSVTEVSLNPRTKRAEFAETEALSATVSTRDLVDADAVEAVSHRRRTLAGHAFMVDVEPGKQRIRLKLPQGQDLTIDVDESSLAAGIKDALDRPVEIDVEEEVLGGVSSRPVAKSIHVILSDVARTGIPSKSIVALMTEQNLPTETPNYQDLASEVWSTEAELNEFESYLRSNRRATG